MLGIGGPMPYPPVTGASWADFWIGAAILLGVAIAFGVYAWVISWRTRRQRPVEKFVEEPARHPERKAA